MAIVTKYALVTRLRFERSVSHLWGQRRGQSISLTPFGLRQSSLPKDGKQKSPKTKPKSEPFIKINGSYNIIQYNISIFYFIVFTFGIFKYIKNRSKVDLLKYQSVSRQAFSQPNFTIQQQYNCIPLACAKSTTHGRRGCEFV